MVILIPSLGRPSPTQKLHKVGMTEKAAREQWGDKAKVFVLPMTEGDRSQAEGNLDGFIKIIYKGSDDLLGATIVASRAGEMIQEFANAMSNGGGLP